MVTHQACFRIIACDYLYKESRQCKVYLSQVQMVGIDASQFRLSKQCCS